MKSESHKPDPKSNRKGRPMPREDWKKGTDVVDGLKDERRALAQQAKALLAGEVKWRPTVEHYPRPTYS
jgi:hypothetical protein